MSSPSNRISPDCARTRPEIARATLLLPAPLTPSSAVTDCGATVKDTPGQAVASAYFRQRSLPLRMSPPARGAGAGGRVPAPAALVAATRAALLADSPGAGEASP